MTPGIYTDLDARDYHALHGASASRLRKLWQSTPAHLRAEMDEPREDNPAFKLGTLAHAVILEPDKPLPNLVTPPDEYAPGKKWTYAATACKEWRASQEREGNTVLSREDYDALLGMTASVAAHPWAAASLESGRSEVTCLVHDSANRVDVRCRLDFVPDARPYLVDFKTALSASAREFERAAFSHGYHIQAALYLAAWNALAGSDDKRSEFRFVVVEKTPPYAVNVFDASPEFLSRGAEDFKRTLALFARCVAEDHWPAYEPTIKPIGLPKFADFV